MPKSAPIAPQVAPTPSLQPSMEIEDPSKGNALTTIFPGWAETDDRESVMVSLPSAGAACFAGMTLAQNMTGMRTDSREGIDGTRVGTRGGDGVPAKHILPAERASRYVVLRRMAADPTIDSAIKMHISNAFACKNGAGDAVSITSIDGKPNKIADELNSLLKPIIADNLTEWARKAAVYGSCFARVYGERGKGVTNVRCDYYTQAQYIQKFTKGGKLAGYTCTYQGAQPYGKSVRLLPPWEFVGFEIPEWRDNENVEPVSVSGIPVDLSVDDYAVEGLIESQDYGESLIATAYGPWMDLLDALCSLKMSRRNAARLERLVAISTGKLDPERAARYLDMIAERITNASNEVQTQSFLHGSVQTVVNHLFPVYGEKGSVQVDAVQGTPDINGLEDVLFHVKRLGSALGIDPALLGFGDFLAGGLGDGGFFRVSVLAGAKALYLRTAIERGLQRLCEIHVAYKYGKVFLPAERPWKIVFNGLATAIEREEQESLEGRAGIVGSIIGAISTLDQEFAIVDKREFARKIWGLMKFDGEEFEKIFPEDKARQAEKMEQERMEGGYEPEGRMPLNEEEKEYEEKPLDHDAAMREQAKKGGQ